MTNLKTKIEKATEEKLYKRFDIQDTNDFSIETLQDMRVWLADFWNENPDEDMDDKEHEEMIEAIMVADENEIFERLGGVGYSWCEVDTDPSNF
ncbi:hypothetical protein MKX73_19195 [Solibacillus sp. FSL W7-1436]|uniref:hypothetical protein n=1 Tax=Solibacillus sp. FSL W7-1436 TaxID=2921705 RepID=UPI0030F83E6C